MPGRESGHLAPAGPHGQGAVAEGGAAAIVIAVQAEGRTDRAVWRGVCPVGGEINAFAAEYTQDLGLGNCAAGVLLSTPFVLGDGQPGTRVVVRDPALEAGDQHHVGGNPGLVLIVGVVQAAHRTDARRLSWRVL